MCNIWQMKRASFLMQYKRYRNEKRFYARQAMGIKKINTPMN
jgi:hypothetical protein